MQTQIVDGKKIRDKIKEDLILDISNMDSKPKLVLFYIGNNPVIDVFVNLKKKFGESIGIAVEIIKLDESISENELIEKIKNSVDKNTGIIVQLPLPKHLDQEKIISTIPQDNDTDLLREDTFINLGKEKGVLPPVIGAIDEIFKEYSVDLKDKKIVIIGKGRLVGDPARIWLEGLGIRPTVLTRSSMDFNEVLLNADIVISGAGSPGLIKKDNIKDGAILIDAGTSEVGVKILGDVDSSVLSKASLLTPVPGGIGPITIAVLFRNLVRLNR